MTKRQDIAIGIFLLVLVLTLGSTTIIGFQVMSSNTQVTTMFYVNILNETAAQQESFTGMIELHSSSDGQLLEMAYCYAGDVKFMTMRTGTTYELWIRLSFSSIVLRERVRIQTNGDYNDYVCFVVV